MVMNQVRIVEGGPGEVLLAKPARSCRGAQQVDARPFLGSGYWHGACGCG